MSRRRQSSIFGSLFGGGTPSPLPSNVTLKSTPETAAVNGSGGSYFGGASGASTPLNGGGTENPLHSPSR